MICPLQLGHIECELSLFRKHSRRQLFQAVDAGRVGAGGAVCDAVPGGVVFGDGAVCGGAGRIA